VPRPDVYATDRQTDRRQTLNRRQTKASINASALWGRRHNNAGRMRAIPHSGRTGSRSRSGRISGGYCGSGQDSDPAGSENSGSGASLYQMLKKMPYWRFVQPLLHRDVRLKAWPRPRGQLSAASASVCFASTSSWTRPRPMKLQSLDVCYGDALKGYE